MTDPQPLAYRGVIEGFYGRPWTHDQRVELLGQLAGWGAQLFVYGPKDDIKVRAAWRARYSEGEARALARLVEAGAARGVEVHYAIAPGLDIAYADPADRAALLAKVEQVLELGVRGITLLFDDIPSGLAERDARAFSSFGHAQADVTNELYAHLRQRGVPLLFCPTEYCDRFATPSVEESPYLHALGDALHSGVEVYWTGPEIVSETVPLAAAQRFGGVVRRPPVLWDNLHANDYDGRRLYLGPYAGRPAELRSYLRGAISNPNVEHEANFVPLHTFAAWLRGDADGADGEARALARAVDEWLPRFATYEGAMARAELSLLVDYLYLPFRHGPNAEAHLAAAKRLTGQRARPDVELAEQRARALRELYVRVTELTHRELAYALYPYVWDLKEEADVWARYARHDGGPFCRPDALANTYRTGIMDAFQRQLPLADDGCARP